MDKKKKYFFIGLLVGILTMTVFCLITVMCVVRHYTKTIGGSSGYVSAQESILDSQTVAKIEKIQSLFDNKSIYDISDEDMQRGMIDGLIKGTGDKYAKYFDKEEIRELFDSYEGKIYGIGATLSLNDMDLPEIQKVYEDSPAQKVGLRAGDIIVKVDDADISGKSLDDSVALIRGDKGTSVKLTVYREGEDDYLELYPVRDEIKIELVEYEMLDNNIGYIHIASWYETTPKQFTNALDELKAAGMESLIIDLRSNTGGLLDSVVDTCREVLPKGLIVYTETNKGKSSSFECDGKKEINVPVVILTNGYTASASEIFTAAMKDHGKAISMGTKTYGKGVVQSFEYFEDGTAIKLTEEQYFTPNGVAIDGIGIEPDIEVEFDGEAYYNSDNPVDNQLEAAKEYLLKK